MDEVAGRVLLLSDAGRVLLVGSVNPEPGGPTVWVAPGGTAEPGETAREAASRELHEEVGLEVSPEELVGPIGVSDRPGRHVVYFVHPLVDGYLPTVENPDAVERAVWVGFRWWTADDVEATRDVVWPSELAEVLRSRSDLPDRTEPWQFVWGR